MRQLEREQVYMLPELFRVWAWDENIIHFLNCRYLRRTRTEESLSNAFFRDEVSLALSSIKFWLIPLRLTMHDSLVTGNRASRHGFGQDPIVNHVEIMSSWKCASSLSSNKPGFFRAHRFRVMLRQSCGAEYWIARSSRARWIRNRNLLVESYQRRVRRSSTNDQISRIDVGFYGAERRSCGRDNAF